MSQNDDRVKPYNPLDKKNLGVSVANQMLAQTAGMLPPAHSFEGAGLYAIYYTGNFPEYEPIARMNRDDQFSAPIYVGKAVPAGARMGGFGLDTAPGFVLFNRLREHAESIKQAVNLNLGDFYCRYLVVDDIWIPLAESLLITTFKPIWNTLLTGFGNHDPGNGRYNQRRSYWDEVHQGRSWAIKCQPSNKTEAELLTTIRLRLEKNPEE